MGRHEIGRHTRFYRSVAVICILLLYVGVFAASGGLRGV